MTSSSPGFFSADHSVYTITNMFPKRHLRNFLWNEHFIASIDQFGGGASWNRDNEIYSGACPVGESRLLFLRDKKDGTFWAANRNFFREPFDEFYTEVGQGFSRIVSCYKGLRLSYRIFIPRTGNVECWTVEIENVSAEPKEFSLFTYAASHLNTNPHPSFNHGEFDAELGGVLLSHHAFNTPKVWLNHFLASDISPVAHETTNRRFQGVYGSISMPDAVQAGRLASESTSFDNNMALTLQFDLTLAPGEKRQIHLLNGLASNAQEAREMAHQLLKQGGLDSELAAVEQRAKSAIDKVFIQTPDEEINALVNVWLKRQIDLGKTWARTYTRGFRDIMQDSTAFMPLDPKTAAEKIKYCLAYQRADGNPLRQWEPTDLHPSRDGAVWLILAVATYLKETGCFDLLNDVEPYYESQETGTVLEHCRRGMHFLLDNLGSHGLCLWGGGDWNDAINNAGLQGRGESVWLTQATVVAAREFVCLLKRLGDDAQAEAISLQADALAKNLQQQAWEKDHFICGYTDWDEKVGSYDNAEAQIFLNMQTWAVLSGTASDGPGLMDFVERELATPWGYVLNKPCFTRRDDHIGRNTYYEKGCYENGSVYNHGGTFKIAADCMLGRGELAYQTVRMMLSTNPANPAEHSGVEPYAVSNMYLGPENQERSGEAIMSWVTGTAGWLFRSITEYMLGVQADYDGLALKPCLSSQWKEVSIRREYRGAVYRIEIQNPSGLETGTLTVVVDGKPLGGNILPVFSDGQEHRVTVTLKPV